MPKCQILLVSCMYGLDDNPKCHFGKPLEDFFSDNKVEVL